MALSAARSVMLIFGFWKLYSLLAKVDENIPLCTPEVPTSGYKKKDKEVADNAWLSLRGFFLHEQGKAASAVELFLDILADSVDELLFIVSLSSSLFSPSLCHLLL